MDFKAPYNRSDYVNFFRSHLLPEDFRDHSEDVAIGFKAHFINNAVKIGEVLSLELHIYEVAHPSENDPRVSLSRDAFRLLAQYGAKRALIIFTSENSQNFRLSLVTIDLKWEEGRRIQKEYSNPRRYSFFLGPETKVHTPQEYLIKQGRVKDFDDLKERFSIEVVNKEFYTQIAVLFTQLAGGKREIGRKSIDAGPGYLKLPSTSDDTLRKEFTVRLIGRLVFCWFLKKKRSENDLSLLPEELLSSEAVSGNKSYYHSILEPLFFEVLNTPIEKRQKKYQGSHWPQIPFLNGGLFTPHLHDFYDPGPLGISKHINTLKIPDEWTKELFDIFETYNFTIDENTSVDVELSIEPEMLGRIFENLLAEINPETGETARKATGSYYTPRPIVEYMVDESLKQYLSTKTKLGEDKITRLLTYEDVEIKLTGSEKESILNALDAIKIIDPACGSGAFPMGILQKMLLILQKIDPESEWWLDKKLSQIESKLLKKELGKKLKAENVNYVHKLGIIQSSIYGVDIQPIAVEISKLRFFLSLIVDETVNDTKENRGIEPLPNLEFKFVCANSLIGLPKKGDQKTLFEADDDIKLLRDLRDEYLRSYGNEKKRVEKKFLEVQSKMAKHALSWALWGGEKSQTMKLSQWDPFAEEPCSWFDPEWMFGVKDGFDVVIANPPYGANIDKDVKLYAKLYLNTTKAFKDIYKIFIEFGLLQLTKSGSGILCYIIPNTLILQPRYKDVRQFLLRYSILEILNFGEGIFDQIVPTCVIFVLSSTLNQKHVKFADLSRNSKFTGDINAIQFEINDQAQYLKSPGFIFTGDFRKLKSDELLLDSVLDIKDAGINYQRVNVGLADKGNSDLSERLLYEGQKNAVADIEYWKGEDIQSYYIAPRTNRYVKINIRLRENERVILNKLYFEIKPKLLWRQTASYPIVGLDQRGVWFGRSIQAAVIKNEKLQLFDHRFLLALLNSSYLRFLYTSYVKESGRVFPQVKLEKIKLLPIKQIDKHRQQAYADIVDKIIAFKKEKDYFDNSSKQSKVKECEHQIDQMVYELYGLTKKEIEIVENSFS